VAASLAVRDGREPVLGVRAGAIATAPAPSIDTVESLPTA
jgi:hypothetical protein